jgi:hypothetical protein
LAPTSWRARVHSIPVQKAANSQVLVPQPMNSTELGTMYFGRQPTGGKKGVPQKLVGHMENLGVINNGPHMKTAQVAPPSTALCIMTIVRISWESACK